MSGEPAIGAAASSHQRPDRPDRPDSPWAAVAAAVAAPPADQDGECEGVLGEWLGGGECADALRLMATQRLRTLLVNVCVYRLRAGLGAPTLKPRGMTRAQVLRALVSMCEEEEGRTMTGAVLASMPSAAD